jgi:LmbE family N-acetylglucosaminyl deacetylase
MMLQLNSKGKFGKKHMNAAVFCAHPDDETIFMGGTILNHPDWSWNIYCFTYMDNSMRGRELKKAIGKFRSFGVKHINFNMLGFNDSKDPMVLGDDFRLYRLALKEIGKNKKFDVIFTHNKKGDYGHPQHIMVQKAVRKEFKGNNSIWEFICLGAEKVVPAPILENLVLMQLDRKSLERKLKVFESYSSQMSTWKDLFPVMNYEFKIGIEIFTSK